MPYGDQKKHFEHLKLPVTWGVMGVVGVVCVIAALMFIGDRRDQGEAALASRGGLYFSSAEDFSGCLHYLQENPNQARRLGENGQRYVLANFSWDRVVRKYRQAFQSWGFDL